LGLGGGKSTDHLPEGVQKTFPTTGNITGRYFLAASKFRTDLAPLFWQSMPSLCSKKQKTWQEGRIGDLPEEMSVLIGEKVEISKERDTLS